VRLRQPRGKGARQLRAVHLKKPNTQSGKKRGVPGELSSRKTPLNHPQERPSVSPWWCRPIELQHCITHLNVKEALSRPPLDPRQLCHTQRRLPCSVGSSVIRASSCTSPRHLLPGSTSLSACSPRSLASEYAEASSAAFPNSRAPSSNGSIIETRTQNPSFGPRRPSLSFSNATAQKRLSPISPSDANE
jgi:hypothetical protein